MLALRRAFTLIELLVVMAIAGVLIGLLLPAVQKIRESAAQTACKNNLKQLVLAFHTFENNKGRLPVLYSSNDGWGLQILPYIEQSSLLKAYTPYTGKITWQSLVNASVVATPLEVMQCPVSWMPTTTSVTASDGSPQEYARADYFTTSGVNATAYQNAFGVAPADASGIFGPQIAGSAPTAGRRFVATSDGLSNTIMISECSGRPWPFISKGRKLTSTSDPNYLVTPAGLFPAKPATDRLGNITWAGVVHGAWAHNNTYNVNTFNAVGNIGSLGICSVNCSNFRGIYSFHPNGAFAAFGDGSVRMLGVTLSAQVLMAITTARNDEAITLE